MASIVLVPGGFHGGWYFSPILPALREAGHDVHTITLTGLGGPPGRQWPAINLDTHIDDVVALIENEKLTDVVLCGHSYAGLVIAGAADRLPGRIRTLLFVDALVPRDGESVWTTWDAAQRDAFVSNSPDGIVTKPPPGVDARARPHPLACFIQPISLGVSAYDVGRKVFVWCSGRAESPFKRVHQRVVEEGGWLVHRIPFGHDIMNEAPKVLRDIIISTAAGRDQIWDVLPASAST
jgi:pimeloyl-ACP methyl ester carboxylesterase